MSTRVRLVLPPLHSSPPLTLTPAGSCVPVSCVFIHLLGPHWDVAWMSHLNFGHLVAQQLMWDLKTSSIPQRRARAQASDKVGSGWTVG